MSHALWLERFINLYNTLGTDNFTQLAEVYHSDVMFRDPMHQIMGLNALIDYFEHLYQNVESCTFKIEHIVATDDEAAVYWRMTYRHKRLNRNQPILVEGHTQLKQRDGLVGYHRDYIDIGEMVYEHIPLLGRVVRMIKQRAGQQ